ncbi:MAG: hypothetical protein JWN77_1310 [Frankiales bacterium]|nr:hypothetical protein [Frankiales bacterium]
MTSLPPTATAADLARVQVQLATAAADATPLAELDVTARDLTRVQPLLDQVIEAVAGLLDAPRAAMWVTDPSTQTLYAVSWRGFPDGALDELRVPYGVGSVGRATTERSPALVHEILDDAGFAPVRGLAADLHIATAFSMPMLTLAGEAMGALSCYYPARTEPGEREIGLVELYARQAAEMVERARMHAEARMLAERERQRAGQLRALASAALQVSASETLDDLLRLGTESARAIVGTHQAVTSRLPHGWTDATTYVSLSEEYAQWRDYAEVPQGRGVLECVIRENKPLRLTGEELRAHPEFRGLRDAPGHPPMPDYLAAPLIGRSGVNLGLVQLSHKTDGSAFTAEDEAILVQLAQMASSAVEGLEALTRERAARRDAELAAAAQAALSQASAAFAELLDPVEVARALAHLVVPRLAEIVTVHLVEDSGDIEVAAVHAVDPLHATQAREFFTGFRTTLDQPYGAGHVVRNGEPQLVGAVSDDVVAAMVPDADERAAVYGFLRSSCLSVPLVARGRTIGALSLARDEEYTGRDLAYAVDLGRRAGLAMDNASRFAFERGLADALQRSLLPRSTPDSVLLTTASRYLPGAAGTQIGGDWYDVIEMSRGRLMVVVGDVMGRGVQAAAVMGQLRATVRAYAIEGHGPAALLARLDRVVQSLDDVNFTTCVVGVLDPSTRNLCLASAGHLLPVLISPDGEAEFLELDPGLPLGVGEAEFVDQWFDLEAGATVLLYTDGLVEGRERSLDEGMDRLRALCSAPVRSADELCDRVLGGMSDGAVADDDTALLALLLDESGAAHAPPLLLELAASAESAGAAREALCGLLGGEAGEEGELACLLLTELVTNAVRYAGGQISVRAGVRSDLLLVEVRDASERMPVVGDPSPDAEGGRGMLLVDRLSDRWGVEPLPVGKRVWFELSLRSA